MSAGEEKAGYIKLYTYFYTRQRIGVVGNCYSGVKDMYILPLASHDPIPSELKPLPGKSQELVASHPDVLPIHRTCLPSFRTYSLHQNLN